MIPKKKKLTKITIDELEVFRTLGIYAKLNESFKSPFRKDNKPGCKLKLWRGKIRFMDSGDPVRHGKDCIAIYGIQNNLSYIDAFKAIIKGYSTETVIQREQTKKVVIPDVIDFTKEGLEFWDNLRDENIFQIKGYYIVGSSTIYFPCDDLAFAYKFEDEYKIYRPFNTQTKWIGSVKKNNCWWEKQGSDKLLIIKSSKDFLFVRALFRKLNIKIDITHFQSEGISKYIDNVTNISKIKLYKKVYIFWDNDNAGLTNSKILSNHLISLGIKTKLIYTPLFYKDFTELYKTDKNKAIQFLNKHFNE